MDEIVKRACCPLSLQAFLQEKTSLSFEEVHYKPDLSLISLFKKENTFLAWQTLPEQKCFTLETDPKLSWLDELQDREKMSRHLNQAVIKITPLSYKPLMRATFLYEFENTSWIGKTNCSKDPYQQFIQAENVAKLVDCCPKPVHFLTEPPIIFFQKLPGTACPFNEKWMLKEAGKNLRMIHGLKTNDQMSDKTSTYLRNLERGHQLLIHLKPELQKRANNLYTYLVKELANTIRSSDLTHCDFHKGNLLMNGKTLYIIDLEDLSRGDARMDIGRFLSSIRAPYLRKTKSLEGFDALKDHFLEGYGSSFPINKLILFEAASLFTTATSGFRFQREDWENEAVLLFKEAERILSC